MSAILSHPQCVIEFDPNEMRWESISNNSMYSIVKYMCVAQPLSQINNLIPAQCTRYIAATVLKQYRECIFWRVMGVLLEF